jgi:hypothetical protein
VINKTNLSQCGYSTKGSFLLLNSLLVIVLAGCVQEIERSTPVFPVDGQLFIDGRPGVGVSLEFHPLSSASSDNFFPCLVKEDGHFVPTQKDGAIGLPAGRYRIVIKQRESVSGNMEERELELPKTHQEIEVKETINLLPAIKIRSTSQSR